MASIWTAIAMALLLISLGSQLAARPSGRQPKRRALLVGLCCVAVLVLALSLYLSAACAHRAGSVGS